MPPDVLPVPDAIRHWFATHPGQSVRPAELAVAIGVPTHRAATAARRLLDTGELVRFRPVGGNTAGPGSRYARSDPYRDAATLEEWLSIRDQRNRAKKETTRS